MTPRCLIPVILLLVAGCTQAQPGRLVETSQPAQPPATSWPAALAGVANLGFADDRAGDGRGGWSDQGPWCDFAEFEVGRTVFGGIPFAIADPAANGGRAVVSFRHATLVRGPAEVVAPFPAAAHGRFLYLLHTACRAEGIADGGLGSAEILCRDGSAHRIGIDLGREVSDWMDTKPLANGPVVVAKPFHGALAGIRLSRFDLGSEMEATGLRLATTGRALWIVVGATLSARDLPLPACQPLTVAAGSAWKPLPYGDLVVKAGTALDRSAWLDHAPAGCRGRIIARADGRLAFANDPTRPVRFFCCSAPDWGGMKAETADPEAFAEAVRRQGYNMVRFSGAETLLSPSTWGRKIDAAGIIAFDARLVAGQALDPAGFAQIDRFTAALKERGIYLYLDVMDSPAGYYPVNAWTPDHGVPDLKTRLFGDPVARTHYQAAVSQLLTHRNPRTGLTLAEDPMVAVMLGFNEQELNLWAGKGWHAPLLGPWRAFLARRYPEVAAWRAVWGGSLPAGAGIADTPIFALDDADTGASGARQTDVAGFLAEVEAETAGFMEGVARNAGYPGIFTQYDYLKNLRYSLARTRLGAVAMHAYHAHPSNFIVPGSTILQTSAVGDALGWWRGMAAVRIAGLPQLFTEYGQVYWNRYRYEEGLAVGAYAALQDVDALLGHSFPVQFTGRTLKSFRVANDPVARASQVVTGLAWRGGAVASARHRVDVQLSRSEALAHSYSAIAGDQSRLLLLTGFATAVEGAPTPAVKADALLPLLGGAKVVSTAAVSGVLDQSTAAGFAGAIADLRQRGILPPGNRTDAASSRYESDTGEILLEARQRRLSVATPTLAGICADEVDAPLASGDLRLLAASVPLSLTAASLDGRPLTTAARILVVLATDARNDGEEYADSEGMVMRKLGTGPVVVRTGRFACLLRRAAGAPALQAWALAQDGTRRDPIAVSADADGLRLDLDSAAWGCGPTPFIELATP